MGRFIGGGRNGPATETPEGRLAMEIPRLFASRNGTVNSRPCFAPGRNLSDSCIGKARGMLRGLFCAASNRSGRSPPPHALDYSEYLSITIFRPLMGALPLGENGQRCCGLKAPMVLIRSSKSSRETSVCPLIFDR